MKITLLAACFIAGSGFMLTSSPGRATDCSKAQTQMALTECAGSAFEKSDAQLNKVYKEAMSRLKSSPDKAKLLKASEKAWISFRDAQCRFISSAVEGGSAQPMIQADCANDLTKARTKALSDLLTCQEGDMSCPIPPK